MIVASKITWLMILSTLLLAGILFYGFFLFKELSKDPDIGIIIRPLPEGPVKEIDKEAQELFELANSKLIDEVRFGSYLKRMGNLAEWLSLVLSSFLAFLAGIYGSKVTPKDVSKLKSEDVLNESNRTKNKMVLIGALLALVVVINSVGDQVEKRGLEIHEASRGFRDEFNQLKEKFDRSEDPEVRETVLKTIEFTIEGFVP